MYKRLEYKKARVRQIIKSREKDENQDEFFKQTLDRIVSEPKVQKVLEMLGDD